MVLEGSFFLPHISMCALGRDSDIACMYDDVLHALSLLQMLCNDGSYLLYVWSVRVW